MPEAVRHTLIHYTDDAGHDLFGRWLNTLADVGTRASIAARLVRLERRVRDLKIGKTEDHNESSRLVERAVKGRLFCRPVPHSGGARPGASGVYHSAAACH